MQPVSPIVVEASFPYFYVFQLEDGVGDLVHLELYDPSALCEICEKTIWSSSALQILSVFEKRRKSHCAVG